MAATPKRVVFIDTTELMSKGRSPIFAGDLSRLKQSGHNVVTSTLVLDELEANYVKHRREVGKKYGHYFPADVLPDPPALKEQFAEHLAGAGVITLPITVDVRDVIQADLKSGQPFKKEGAGYRDFINWVTFVDHVKTTRAGAGSFLTDNHRDFGGGGSLPSSLDAVAKARGCSADLETRCTRDFLKDHLAPVPAAQPVEQQHLDAALDGWISIAEDAEILRAMGVSGPLGIELMVLGVRDKEADLLRGPDSGAVQMVFRATFDCAVVLASRVAPRERPVSHYAEHRPWTTDRRSVRLEWTVEAAFDETRGIMGVPMQIAPLRQLNPDTGDPLN